MSVVDDLIDAELAVFDVLASTQIHAIGQVEVFLLVDLVNVKNVPVFEVFIEHYVGSLHVEVVLFDTCH